MKYFLLLFTLFATQSYASFVESCELTGTVLSKPIYTPNPNSADKQKMTIFAYYQWFSQFEYHIITAKPNGRADMGCKHFVGKVQTVNVYARTNTKPSVIKQGDKLTLNYTKEDSRGAVYEIFRLKQ